MIYSLRIVASKLVERQPEILVGERFWTAPDLPSLEELTAAWDNLFARIESPFLVAPARAEAETIYGLRTHEIDQWTDEADLAGRVLKWAANVGVPFD